MDSGKDEAALPMKAGRHQHRFPLHDVAVTSPRQMPDLRLTMLDRWRPGAFYDFAHRQHAMRMGRCQGAKAFDPVALASAQLWYVTPEMSQLVAHAAETLPPTTLCDDLVPERDGFGLVVWGSPMIGTDVENLGEIAISVNLWGPTYKVGERILVMKDGLPAEPGRFPGSQRTLTVSNYRYEVADIASAYLPAGTSDWLWDTETHDALDENIDPVVTMSASEERRWLSALWLLASQPLTTDQTQPAERAARKRSERRAVASDVRVIDVRSPKRAATAHDSEHERTIEWRQRWMVEGHWRQQAYGPGWSLHRPQWIAPFVKGPDDKPLKLREDVRVVRSGSEGR